MSVPSLQIQPSQEAALRTVREIGSGRFGAVQDAVEGLTCFTSKGLKTALLSTLSGEEADALISLCLFISAWRRESGHSSKEILEGLSNGLLDVPKEYLWASSDFEDWRAMQADFEKLLNSDAVGNLGKFLELSYDYGKLWRTGRILADIRPVFDETGDSINCALVSFTMRLEYQESGDTQNLTLTLDEQDIRQLSKECERALNKAKVAKEFLENPSAVPVSIAGSENS